MKTLFSTLALGLISLSAAAEWDRTPAPGPYSPSWVTCRTTAGFQTFEDGDYSMTTARSRVIASCSQWKSASDCRSNVQCDVPMADWYTCKTTAGFQSYKDSAASWAQALDQTIASCSAWKDAGECRYNAQCKSPMSNVYFTPMTTCNTSSGYQTFRDADLNPETARQRTINRCSQWKNPGECRARVVCVIPTNGFTPTPPVFTPPHDPRIDPRFDSRVSEIDATPEVHPHNVRVKCETYSGRIRVVGRGHSSGVVNARVTEVCRHTPGTYPRDCDNNVRCSVR